MSIPKFSSEKDPSDVDDWQMDWSGIPPLQDGDSITAISSIDISPVTDPPLVESTGQRAFTSTTTTIWLTGGLAGNVYTVTQTVTTAQSRTFQRSAKVKVKEL